MTMSAYEAVYRQFDPDQPLGPGDKRYVPLEEARGAKGLYEAMAKTIAMDDRPTAQLFCGPIGCGLTSGLHQFTKYMKELPSGERWAVSYCNAEDVLELTDVELDDVALAVAITIVKAAKEHEVALAPNDFFGGLKDLLEEMGDKVHHDLGAALDALLGLFKASPNFRGRARAYLANRRNLLKAAVNALAERVLSALLEKGLAGLVVIVDNLEKMSPREHPTTRESNVKRIYHDGHALLRDVGCHVIYTFPHALSLSGWAARLPDLYKTNLLRLPMVRARQRSGAEDPVGMAALRDLVNRRLQAARPDLTADEAFEGPAVVDRLIEISGGHPRRLVRLVRRSMVCLGQDELPVLASSVEEAINVEQIALKRLVSEEVWGFLEKVHATKELPESPSGLGGVLDTFVLEYLDKTRPWYEVNPLLRDDLRIRGAFFAPQ